MSMDYQQHKLRTTITAMVVFGLIGLLEIAAAVAIGIAIYRWLTR